MINQETLQFYDVEEASPAVFGNYYVELYTGKRHVRRFWRGKWSKKGEYVRYWTFIPLRELN